MITDHISTDKLLTDIENQIEIVSVIAGDNAILLEQLRLLHESHEAITSWQAEALRLEALLDEDMERESWTILDRLGDEPE